MTDSFFNLENFHQGNELPFYSFGEFHKFTQYITQMFDFQEYFLKMHLGAPR